MERGAILTLPNALSLSRIALAGAFVLISGNLARVALVLVASATDFLDGFIARRRHQENSWGALLDPITDRVFVFSAVCAYLFRGEITVWQYVVLLSRDIATALGFLVARVVPRLRPVRFAARPLGKLVTGLQLAALLAVLVLPPVVPALVIIVGIAAAAAITDYTIALWRARGARA